MVAVLKRFEIFFIHRSVIHRGRFRHRVFPIFAGKQRLEMVIRAVQFQVRVTVFYGIACYRVFANDNVVFHRERHFKYAVMRILADVQYVVTRIQFKAVIPVFVLVRIVVGCQIVRVAGQRQRAFLAG